jgi:hypothetical protein
VKLAIGFAHLLNIISRQRRKSALRRPPQGQRRPSDGPGDVLKIEAGDGAVPAGCACPLARSFPEKSATSGIML